MANRNNLLSGNSTGTITVTAGSDSKVITVTISKAGYSYTFLNGTDASMQVWINNILYDTIPARDSVTLMYTPASYPVSLYFKSIVAANSIYWTDTIRSAQNYHYSHYANSDWFLLRLTNNTDKIMSTVVVRNTNVNDSSSINLPIGTTQNIGFYKSDASTYIATYYNNADKYKYWSSLNTVNTSNDALLENLIASGSLVN
jgi:uncharacterized protein YifN (PemK superfamily)